MDIRHGYSPLPVPVGKPFDRLTREEAEQYFAWFTAHVDERAEYVRANVTAALCLSPNAVNYSMDSIIPVWRWFLQLARLEPTPKARLEKLKNALKANREPAGFIQDAVRAAGRQLSLLSLYMLRDIGMYTGKTFLVNYPALRWGYHTDTKKDSFANIPQLFGFVDRSFTPPFEMQFDPVHYAEMAASNLTDGSASETDLYDLCMKWAKRAPDGTPA